ncbi:MAG: porin family protein [Candidatus Manganitrophus sp. SA1]|nr:porin family protein [Candidatus Manganitrophus morganii]
MKGFGLKTGLCVIAFIVAGALSAHAQDRENERAWFVPEIANVGAGVHGGFLSSRDGDGGEGFAGAHLRFRVLSFMGLEVSAGTLEETFLNESIVLSEIPLSVSGLIYPVGAPFTVLPWPVTPYLIGGVTWVYFRTDFEKGLATPPTNLQNVSPLEHDVAPGWHAGGGFDIGITENVTFSVEYRATFWDFRENIDNAAVRAALPDLETNNYTVRGALTFLFH